LLGNLEAGNLFLGVEGVAEFPGGRKESAFQPRKPGGKKKGGNGKFLAKYEGAGGEIQKPAGKNITPQERCF